MQLSFWNSSGRSVFVQNDLNRIACCQPSVPNLHCQVRSDKAWMIGQMVHAAASQRTKAFHHPFIENSHVQNSFFHALHHPSRHTSPVLEYVSAWCGVKLCSPGFCNQDNNTKKTTPKDCLVNFGWGGRTRTLANGARTRRPTTRRPPNGIIYYTTRVFSAQ